MESEPSIQRNAKLLLLAKTEVKRRFRYVREDFFLADSSCSLDNLNGQFGDWLDTAG